jgi:hypothetical protein
MMNNLFYLGIVISTLLSTFILYYIVTYWILPKIEGFKQDEKKPDSQIGNPLLNLISKMKRMTSYLISPSMWIERIEMVNMSPAELARRHLKSIAKTE